MLNPAPSSVVSTPQRRVSRAKNGWSLSTSGFTLIELLVVMGIMVLLLSLLGPVVNALKGSNDMDQAASDLGNMIQLCRSYAMANNTYVYLGLGEFDVSKPASGVQTAGTGRVAMAAIASKDGTRGYSPYAATVNDIQTGWTTSSTNLDIGYNNGANFVPIGNLLRYDNLHVFDYASSPPASGNMARPDLTGSNYLRLGNSNSNTVTQITYPLGASANYSFPKVLQFDPEGLVRIAPQSLTTYSAQGVPQWLEIAFIQSHGTVAPSVPIQTSGNHVCIQIDGMNGTIRTFRP